MYIKYCPVCASKGDRIEMFKNYHADEQTQKMILTWECDICKHVMLRRAQGSTRITKNLTKGQQ